MVPRPAPADWRQRIDDLFEIDSLKLIGGTAEAMTEMEGELERGPGTIISLGLEPGAAHVLRLKDAARLAAVAPPGHSAEWASIPSNVLRYGIIEPFWALSDEDLRASAVRYSHDPKEVFEFVEGQPGTAGFLLSAVDIGSVMSLADQGERMPQKSTFFHPKLGTGLVFYPLTP
jgi:hypothetical protein